MVWWVGMVDNSVVLDDCDVSLLSDCKMVK